MIRRLEWIIFYFEGTCEICLGNIGIEQYRKEIGDQIRSGENFSDQVWLRIFYASAVIEYKLDNHEKAYEEWQKALSYAKKANVLIYIGKIYSYFAIYYYRKKDNEQEWFYFHEAEKLFHKCQDYGELATHYINILWFKRYEKNPKEVIEYMDKSLRNVRLSNSKKNARVYLHLGYIYKTIFNDYIQAIQYLLKSIELSRENDFIEMESMTMNVLADGYNKIDKMPETINIYTAILQGERYQKITYNLKAAMLCNLINCYLKIKKNEKAVTYLTELEKIMPEVQFNIREIYYAIMIGLKAELCILQKVDLEKALILVQESEQIYEKNKASFIVDDFHIITACRTGDVYYAMGNYHEAIRYFHLMKDQTPNDNLYYTKMAYERLAKIYEQLGDYSAALQALKSCNQKLYEARRKKTDEQFETLHKHFILNATKKEISRLNEQNDRFEMESIQDSLTGLYNRNYLNQYVKKWPIHVENNLSLLMIDIDSFKNYNDHYGHEMGDIALKKIADALKKISKGITDTIIRYGGEEFLIVLEHDKQSAIDLANRIIENMALECIEHQFSEVEKYITVSIGISTCISGPQCDLLKVIEATDQALYCSKKNGKNRYSHADCMCKGP